MILIASAIISCGGATGGLGSRVARIGEGISLRYWMPKPEDADIRFDMEDNRLYRELERRTGVHISFEYSINATAQKQLQVLRESSDLPDILEWNWLESYPGGPDAAMDDGLILPLSERR